MNIGISSSCFYPLYTEKALIEIGKSGVKNCEIFFNAVCELEESFIKQLVCIKNEYGLNVLAIHPTMSLAESFFLFSNYERRFDEGIDVYKRYCEIAQIFGTKNIVMHGAKPNKVLNEIEFFERFAKVANTVKQNGGVLLQENVVKYRAGNLETLKNMKDYLGDLATFCLDIKQSIRGGYSPFDVLEILGENIKHIHISDNNEENDCMLPLKGNFDFKGFFEKAKSVGYKGGAIIEVYSNAYEDYKEIFDSYNLLIKKLV